ncbi:MAG: hypothetical protein ACXQT5_04780 [Candidatus Syntropharchaeia archaeon]
MEGIKETVEKFLEYVGYEVKTPGYIGFVKPEIHAVRKEDNKKYEIVGVIKEGLEAGKEKAVEGFRDLCAAKLILGDEVDYVLILPPTSEHLMIEFLVEKEDWYYPIKNQGFMWWIVNPERETVSSILGWPRDEKFIDYFANPDITAFDALIGRKAAQKMLQEEFE